MLEFRWVGRQLQYRQREFQVDASTHFCGLTDFGPWITVKQREEVPPVVRAVRDILSAYEQHGIGPEFPELENAIAHLKDVFENSIWSRV